MGPTYIMSGTNLAGLLSWVVQIWCLFYFSFYPSCCTFIFVCVLLCLHFLRRGHIDLPLSVRLYVRTSVRPSRKVCITHNSETVCIIDLKLYRYVA